MYGTGTIDEDGQYVGLEILNEKKLQRLFIDYVRNRFVSNRRVFK